MLDRVKDLLARWRDLKDIEALTDRDLADLDMTRDQVRRFALMPRDISERVTAMGAIFGLSEGELKRDHAEWVDLLQVCGACRDRGSCKHLLEKGALANPRDAAFCGNAGNFERHWQTV